MLYSFLITVVILVVESFLSRRNNVYLGAILPVVYLVTLIYLWFSETFFVKSTFSFLLAAFAGLVALLGIWINGRESLKKK
ncbi:hypothetical protein [Aneurinibacillus migulanus]|uniref:hypothetical protein n=1 Tax=Aneurinibacillus migulanus TaxID=47500 RepID=UPI0020A1459D|nr:hypothetical protein [Aneurinibacillus migulanus]MCP1358334.1 hypothetical protein [Aneurinibacillus migulanus]